MFFFVIYKVVWKKVSSSFACLVCYLIVGCSVFVYYLCVFVVILFGCFFVSLCGFVVTCILDFLHFWEHFMVLFFILFCIFCYCLSVCLGVLSPVWCRFVGIHEHMLPCHHVTLENLYLSFLSSFITCWISRHLLDL